MSIKVLCGNSYTEELHKDGKMIKMLFSSRKKKQEKKHEFFSRIK